MNSLLSLNRFDAALENKGWTLQALANEYDQKYPTTKGKTIYNTLRKWHSGKSNPTLQKLVRVCDLLECDIDYLLGRIDYHTHTSKVINDQIGLSELSIKNLQSLFPRNEKMLNSVLSSGKLDTLLSYLNAFDEFACKWFLLDEELKAKEFLTEDDIKNKDDADINKQSFYLRANRAFGQIIDEIETDAEKRTTADPVSKEIEKKIRKL